MWRRSVDTSQNSEMWIQDDNQQVLFERCPNAGVTNVVPAGTR